MGHIYAHMNTDLTEGHPLTYGQQSAGASSEDKKGQNMGIEH